MCKKFCQLIAFLLAIMNWTKVCTAEDDSWNIGLNESKIREIQRLLPSEKVCGSITVDYLSGTMLNSKIQLESGEELFTVIGNETRSLWQDYAMSLTASTINDNCEYKICGETLKMNVDTGTCSLQLYFSEGDPELAKMLREPTSITCLCSADPDCDKSNCNNIQLEPDECARLYTEILCQECYSPSVNLEKVTNGSYKFITYNAIGNQIKSAVVNEGCEIWIEQFSSFGNVPIQILKPGGANTLIKIDQSMHITFKCWNLGSPFQKLPESPEKGSVDNGNPTLQIVIAITVTVVVVIVLSIGIYLAWRKSSIVEQKLNEQSIPIIPTIDLDEFFNGKPMIPKASEKGNSAQQKHYVTVDKLQNNQEDVSETSNQHTIDIALAQPYQWKWEIPKRFIKKLPTVLGKGEFGEVFTGVLDREDSSQPSESVAIKEAQKYLIKSLLTEIKIMSYIGTHPNIVNMLGASVSDLRKQISSSAWLVLELCTNGSLKSFLIRHRQQLHVDPPDSTSISTVSTTNIDEPPSNKLLCKRNFYKWSHEIARGLEFLEKMKILHIDLAARNVLLDGGLVAKIGDFGSARKLYSNTEYWKQVNSDGSSNDALAFKWMALESLKQLVFSSKSEVWSYGVTIWEIFTLGRDPYPQINDYDQLVASLQHGMRLTQPMSADDHIYAYMRRCWDSEPDARPTFTDLQIFFDDQFEALSE